MIIELKNSKEEEEIREATEEEEKKEVERKHASLFHSKLDFDDVSEIRDEKKEEMEVYDQEQLKIIKISH